MSQNKGRPLTGRSGPPVFGEAAACSGQDQQLFFPEGGGGAPAVARAKAFCHMCPCAQACLDYAVDARAAGVFVTGVWGGTTALERVEIRRRRAAAVSR